MNKTKGSAKAKKPRNETESILDTMQKHLKKGNSNQRSAPELKAGIPVRSQVNSLLTNIIRVPVGPLFDAPQPFLPQNSA